jgi:hypothetical protein
MKPTDRHYVADLDEHIRNIVAWHFSEETGSPFWLNMARSLPFDPVADIRSYDDLARFPAVVPTWRTTPTSELVPRGIGGHYFVFETGGTTGAPTRVAAGPEKFENVERVSELLDEHSFPGWDRSEPVCGKVERKESWLYLGATGPHGVGRVVQRLAQVRGFLCHTVDMDPRWVRRLEREGRREEMQAYVEHLLQQAMWVLKGDHVTTLITIPPLIRAIIARKELRDLVRASVQGIIWSATPVADEELRQWEEEAFPDARIVGWYGNALMGIGVQRPRGASDEYRCSFGMPSSRRGACPMAILNPVDFSDASRAVEYGQEGQVRISVLRYETFIPHHLERDRAIRIPPGARDPWDGVARVGALAGGGSGSAFDTARRPEDRR